MWKKKDKTIHKFEFYKEIKTDDDTCQLVEVNPQILACALYRPESIKIFKISLEDYPLIGTIYNCYSHGNNSNGMAKINDKIFCSGGNAFIYIVSVEPIELLQKIDLKEYFYGKVIFTYVFNNYLFSAIGDNIIKFRINKEHQKDLVEYNKHEIIINNFNYEKCYAIAIIDEEKIFYEKSG